MSVVHVHVCLLLLGLATRCHHGFAIDIHVAIAAYKNIAAMITMTSALAVLVLLDNWKISGAYGNIIMITKLIIIVILCLAYSCWFAILAILLGGHGSFLPRAVLESNSKGLKIV